MLFIIQAKCKSFIEYYSSLPQEQRGSFLCELAKDFGIEKDGVLSVASSVLATKVNIIIIRQRSNSLMI